MATISDLRPGDGHILDELFGRMSARSRYLRFHAAVPVLRGAMRNALLDVDGRDHLALVATVDDEVVGVARFIRDPSGSDSAEVAVAVADRWHRHGVGRALLQRLRGRAAAVGINRLRAEAMSENRPAVALFSDVFPQRLVRGADQIVELTALIGAEPHEITMGDVPGELSG